MRRVLSVIACYRQLSSGTLRLDGERKTKAKAEISALEKVCFRDTFDEESSKA